MPSVYKRKQYGDDKKRCSLCRKNLRKDNGYPVDSALTFIGGKAYHPRCGLSKLKQEKSIAYVRVSSNGLAM